MEPPMKCPEDVVLSHEEGEALIERLARDALSTEDRRVLVKALIICFSKSVFRHDPVIGFFVNRYEFGTLVSLSLSTI
jgi:insertion element IS1 protein InsB